MLANYHTHTYRCHHAYGTDEEYIQKAIAEGLKILGFSDHAPYIYPDGYVSYYKMAPSEAGEYFSAISTLREKYRDKIEIVIGYETEYYSDLWESTLEFWKNGSRPEYLLLGQHFIDEEYPVEKRVHSATGTDRPELLTKYIDTLISAIKTKKFTYIAHPDVLRYFGSQNFYCDEVSRLMKAVKSADIPLEINLLGLGEGRHYPTPLFWEVASEYSPKVLLGCDAHEPERVADKNEIANGKRFADKYKLEILDTVPIINPFADLL